MKKFIIALVIFFVLTAFIVTHSALMYRFGEDSKRICEKIEKNAREDKWAEAKVGLAELDKLWEKRRFWASLTIRTNVIEEIDTSIEQSKAYAGIKQKPDFLGEFIMLRLLLEHIPHQEGLHIEEIL